MSNLDLNRFRTELLQDIIDDIRSEETGGIKEEKFTEVALEYLEEAGETEGARPCREIRENSIGNRIHKINGYAINEGFETIDIFITNFKGTSELTRIYSDELKSSINLSTRFVQNLINGKIEGIEETAPVFDFVNTINKIKNQIVRINIYILSDALIPIDPPSKTEFGDILIQYHIRDIEYLHRVKASGSGREPIEVNFLQNSAKPIPCLSMPENNEDYESYFIVVPAFILADIYKIHGAKLLEQNVRTFLQFRGKINKGIRDTILKEPHMFMAYNNGISATAESVELTEDGNNIISIKDFQVVNGGQTTASIFQTRRKFKEVDIDSVCVQMKLTVIRDPEKKNEIVSRISRYANTQNKISEADLTSNHPFHIEMENFSRKIWAAAQQGKNQTRWFYERARGQYNDELSKIDSVGQRKKWQDRNPKNQNFAKEDLARFYNAWEMKPWWVVKGRQRSFIELMKIADDLEPNQVFYEDLIAKAIIFRTAEKLYGTGARAIGDLRYMVVPYTVAWLCFSTEGKMNLMNIWRKQELSENFQNTLYDALNKMDSFMRNTAPGGLIGEWAKKEDCWNKLMTTDLEIDISNLDSELYSNLEISERYFESQNMDEEQRNALTLRIIDLSDNGWIRIDQWGKATGKLDVLQSNFIWKIVRKIEKGTGFSDKEIRKAIDIIDLLKEEAPNLIE
jgi:hypothetical protein